MTTECPHCSQHIEVEGEYVGMEVVTCPTCQEQFSLPPKSGVDPLTASSMGTQTTVRNSGRVRTIQVAIVCVTILIGLLIWKLSGNHTATITAPDGNTTTITSPDGSRIEVNIDAIKYVLQKDHELGNAMKEAQNQIAGISDGSCDLYSKTIRDYVSQAKQIDVSACPRDFAEAYYRHLGAWEDEALAMDAHPHFPDSYAEAIVGGMLRGLNGDLTGGSVQMEDEINAWKSQVKSSQIPVNETWNNVEAIAVRYGAL
jgi:hypothetical protein